MKQQIRYLLSKLLTLCHADELIREKYIDAAFTYIGKINPDYLRSAWLRRSTVTRDFTPLMSDVDLTIVLKHHKLKDILAWQNFASTFPISDIQFISDVLEDYWIETGGFRNRQIPTWKPLLRNHKKLSVTATKSPEFLSFELGHEVHLLYKQTQAFLKREALTSSEVSTYSLEKLLKELERLRLFWGSLDDSILTTRRGLLSTSEDVYAELSQLDQFWGELLSNLHPHLASFNWRELILEETPIGAKLNLEMEGLPVLVVHPSSLKEAYQKHATFYIVTPNYITLVKGIGVQEQTLLNDIAVKATTGYYFKFNLQRLYHDLLNAIILEPENSKRLYFCFYNIELCYRELKKVSTPHWNTIHLHWNENKSLPVKSEQELQLLALAYLDLLVSLT